jgi:hypothetical protein
MTGEDMLPEKSSKVGKKFTNIAFFFHKHQGKSSALQTILDSCIL